ncbi:MAG: hypothetical protein ACD_46C00488G0002 [uncultured bacterium]|nr:MAG: hypothetical protein ACD_46C00488G0002 [uncultured bacterium]
MPNFAMRSTFFAKATTLVIVIVAVIFLSGCASSAVQRDAASNIDMGVQNAKNLGNDLTSGDIADSYQNSSQATKGGILGGATGAATGAMAGSSVGFVPGLAVGTILGASYGSYIDANTTLQDQIENRGANIIVLGDQVMIVLPSSRIFNSMTADIKPTAYSTLNLVAKYINGYTKTLVKVGTYTNDLGSQDVNLALSNQQAKSLVKYFTAAGMDARLLVGVGYGGERLVDNNSLEWNKSDNYRIEITFEKLPTRSI